MMKGRGMAVLSFSVERIGHPVDCDCQDLELCGTGLLRASLVFGISGNA